MADERCCVIMVEVETVPKWQGQSTSVDVDSLLRDYDFVPVMRDAEYETQYNLLYVKTSLVGSLDKSHLAVLGRSSSNPTQPSEVVGACRREACASVFGFCCITKAEGSHRARAVRRL